MRLVLSFKISVQEMFIQINQINQEINTTKISEAGIVRRDFPCNLCHNIGKNNPLSNAAEISHMLQFWTAICERDKNQCKLSSSFCKLSPLCNCCQHKKLAGEVAETTYL